MNKQELAARIWESANNMRSKIEASEYKDYILSLIFYKFLSDKLISYCKETLGADDEWIKENLNEENENIVTDCLRTHGYFIAYNNLFSYWVEDSNFEIANVRDAISSFKRLASSDKSIYQNIYDGIFDTLQLGLSKLGDTSGSQTKTIKQLLSIIEPIPTDSKQGYDVLGFIYEYLINQFASNAGKKAGEFYTPHEVSQVMSEIIAHHLKDRDSIEIYDPTSGSGSLLITIGNSASKYINKDKITYFAQELKENTYSLTRMNLVMHDINPANIKAKNADTLVDDWPIDESDQKPLLVDAVVSNPPYSQKWEPAEDRRFKNYGIAPKSKADFAFLLHDLYHLESDGIMAIVLPHGVLFRGNEEGKIRRNLIENNNIDAIIGLPANIFFGTSIPTCILILKKNRPTNDILVIDASKGFVKADDKNKLRAKDIKKIADTVINRVSIPGYSSVVSKETVRENDYNLNIPRYVDSNNRNESYDLYSSMFGGVPNGDIEKYNKFWDIFPSLKDDLFEKLNSNYSKLKVENINETILNNKDVKEYITKFNNSFEDIDKWLKRELIDNMQFVDITKEENFITDEIL
ncbi:type I restriction-modification system subunit M [Mycoplasmopsis felifaucium]|uniref:site-specific DNA-methyltransferase (adenine-specific) n=1 Tax=Mycoplasmopsis felifaucium TaxID=35768 RepID=A0ABZ2RQN9_9BACT